MNVTTSIDERIQLWKLGAAFCKYLHGSAIDKKASCVALVDGAKKRWGPAMFARDLAGPPTSLDNDKASAFLPLSNTRSMPRASNAPASAPTNYSLNTLGGHPWSDLGGSEAPLNMSDAMNYLDAVKMQFRDKPEVYCQFLDTMQDFRHLRSVFDPSFTTY